MTVIGKKRHLHQNMSSPKPSNQTGRAVLVKNHLIHAWRTTIVRNSALSLHRHDKPRLIYVLAGGKLQLEVITEDQSVLRTYDWPTGWCGWLEADPPAELHGDRLVSSSPMEVLVVEVADGYTRHAWQLLWMCVASCAAGLAAGYTGTCDWRHALFTFSPDSPAPRPATFYGSHARKCGFGTAPTIFRSLARHCCCCDALASASWQANGATCCGQARILLLTCGQNPEYECPYEGAWCYKREKKSPIVGEIPSNEEMQRFFQTLARDFSDGDQPGPDIG
eukprot:g58563.t1